MARLRNRKGCLIADPNVTSVTVTGTATATHSGPVRAWCRLQATVWRRIARYRGAPLSGMKSGA